MRYLLAALAVLSAASCAVEGGGAPSGEAAMNVPHAQAAARHAEVRLPKRWIDGNPEGRGHRVPDDFELPLDPQQLEVRRAPGAPAGEFLLRALEYRGEYEFEYRPDLPRPNYSRNVYAVDFAHDFRVREAAPGEWERAARVSGAPHRLFAPGGDHVDERGNSTRREIEYLGRKFASTGHYWRSATLSPGGRWLAVFSYSGRTPARSFFDFLGGGGPRKGDVYWDLYDAADGLRVWHWEARGVSSPMWWDSTALWVGDKYFVCDGAEQSETLLVVALPDFTPARNPGEVTFPRWLTAEGSAMPTDARYEVRRASATGERELLFGLRAEVEREVRYQTDDRPRREAVMRRRETVHSANLYAVSLDGEYRVRAATRAEWEAAQKVDNTRFEFSPDETYEYEGRRLRRNRPLVKTGASWGTPQALGGGHWVALFSHTGTPSAGEAFVDVYERLGGVRMSAGRFAFAGPPDALFAGAFWADQSYLVVPTGADSRTCLLFMLPELHRAR